MEPKQRLAPKALKPLTDALAGFRTAQPAVHKTIDERALSGAALEDLVDDLIDEVHALDEYMSAFKLLDRFLYDGYVRMRKISNSGGGGSGAAKKPAVAPGA